MRRGRKSIAVARADQLGSLKAVAAFMGVGRTWLSGVKRRAIELAPTGVASPFAGGKTCADWIREFIRLPVNAAFVPTSTYKKAQPSPRRGRVASTSDRSGSPLHPHVR